MSCFNVGKLSGCKMLPDNVSELISKKYEEAVNNGHLCFTESTTKRLKDAKSGMNYVISYAPSLASKPERGDQPDKNPFAEPEPELTVVENVADGEYRLLLNKFPIVPEHTLLVTNAYKDQKSPLSPLDLMTAYKLLLKLDDEDENKRHMMIYNSGPSSGSSQDHKHLQTLRLPQNFVALQDRICAGKSHFLPDFKTEPLQDDKVSFAHFVLPLPESEEDVNEDLLAMCYVSLVQRALTFFQDWAGERPELQKNQGYNVLMTKNWICVVPRSSTRAKSLQIGFNATGYAGLILVKTQEAYDEILQVPHKIDEALLECGFPNTAGKKQTQYSY
ncbi:hypothetical protein HG537_0B00350 [Torulaspora globosa]|uniref:Uncharacterized protein n=1 Tax=Torulaspora globosa TaxID=48254 RepID=A0A7H9HQR5_9SACH|nr:hypothetical protein HG537_0B00350 [Torulaspora sp. CBS 2947]